MANQITITGNIGRAPALNSTQAGKPVWGFSLAYTPSRKTDNGWEDTGPTLWFDVAVWDADAEMLDRIYAGVEKGRATVTGRLGSRSWTNKEGVEQTQITITADAVTIHPPKQQQQASGGYGQRAQAARTHAATSGSDHLAHPAYQPSAGGPRQEPDPMPAPTGGWGGAPSYDEPPF